MAAQRKAASRNSGVGSRASAEALPLDEDQLKDKTGSDSPPPRAGRTGKLGSKAERPADSRARKGSSGSGEPARTAKPPSPNAKKSHSGGRDLPQPLKDTSD